MPAALAEENCTYTAMETPRHPGMAHMNSTIRWAMVSDRQEASRDWVLGLLMTKLWISLSLQEHCVPEVPKEQPQQSTIY